MTFDKFVGEVQHRAQLDSIGDAVRAIRCTLGVLSERLAGGEAEDLAAQLPEEIGYYLLHAEADAAEQFSAQEFLDRVAVCEDAAKSESVLHLRVVFEVLEETITTEQLSHVLDQLPDDYAPLLMAGSEGQMKLNTSVRRKTVRGPAARTRAPHRGGRRRSEPAKASEAQKARSARIARRAA
jgi:uncharacterized protein (DUF2267 family)